MGSIGISNNNEWIALLGKRASTHYTVMAIGLTFIVVFSIVGYYYAMNVYTILKDYMKESEKRQINAMASKDLDNEHYVNATDTYLYGQSDHEAFNKSLEEMKGKYKMYNQTVLEIAKENNNTVTDILDTNIFNKSDDNYTK